MRSSSAGRAAGLALAFGGLALYVWLALQVYRAQADPERYRAWGGPWAWMIGPTARSLGKAAEAHLEAGLAILNDGTKPGAERVAGYREHLRAAEALLVRSLRAQPAQARALSQLAAVRWELDPPVTDEATAPFLDMIATASRMAPQVPEVQLRLGELLLKMGRQAESLGYLSRAIELDAASATRAVGILREALVPPDEALGSLPRNPQVLVALAADYQAAGRVADYLDAIEPALARPTPELLRSLANACLRLPDPERLLRTLDRLPPFVDPALEAERLRQRSRAQLARRDFAAAVADATTAMSLQPNEPSFAEHLGQVALTAGDAPLAVRSFRGALAGIARGSPSPARRASLYSQIGWAEEASHHPELAFDAYRKALELNPDEPHARRRRLEMEKAAGISSGAGP